MTAPKPPSAARLTLVRLLFLVGIVFTWTEGRGAMGDGPLAEDVPLRFTEVADEVGASFRHEPCRVHERVAAIEAQITATGASVAVNDFDGDGDPDLYATTSEHGGHNALFENLGDGTFRDVAADVGLADVNRAGEGVSMGSVWGDFDDDGRQDVLVYKWGRQQLFRNEGADGFRDVTEGSGLERWMNSNAATWIDYDRDGILDLYLTGYFSEEHDLWNLETSRIMHDSFEFAYNGGNNHLYRGNGDGTFTDVTEETNTGSNRWTYAAVTIDLNRDGWVDLYVANDYGAEEVLINRQGRGFDRPGGIGLDSESKSGMCVAIGDLHEGERPSVFVTNISKEGFLFQGNNLRTSFLDLGGGMEQIARGAVVDCGWAWGAQFGDFDNDGWQDLVVVNGFISANPDRHYWYQMTKLGGAAGDVIADAAQWPEFEDRSLSGYERTRVLHNLGFRGSRFREVGREAGVDSTHDGRAVALADLFGTGRLDVIIANQGGPLEIWRNDAPGDHHWIAIDLEGTESGRDAFGAAVRIEQAGRGQLRVHTAASGFASQNEGRAHFGLGDEDALVDAEIRWPSGTVQTIEDLAVDRVHRIEEPRRVEEPQRVEDSR